MLFAMLSIALTVAAQNEVKNKTTGSIKVGTFFVNDFFYVDNNPPDYDGFYLYRTRRLTSEGGTCFFAGYEQLVFLPNKHVLSIEPKIGVIELNHRTGYMVGNDAKYFLKNTGFYRFGLSWYLGYRYYTKSQTEVVSLENGMYEQTLDYDAVVQHIDTDISLIPFQFTFHGGFILESNVGFGISWRFEKPEGDLKPDEARQMLEKEFTHPYFPKIGLKLGYVITGKKKS
jgi:hypothetical protein